VWTAPTTSSVPDEMWNKMPPSLYRTFLILWIIFCPTASYAAAIELKLIQLNQDYNYCRFTFKVVNTTNLNITSVGPYVIFREIDGTVIGSELIGFLRLKPGKEVIADGSIDIDCRVIGSVEFKSFWGKMVVIDGNQEFGNIAVELADGVVVTSSVKQVQAR
jgi:hypothetical protein